MVASYFQNAIVLMQARGQQCQSCSQMISSMDYQIRVKANRAHGRQCVMGYVVYYEAIT